MASIRIPAGRIRFRCWLMSSRKCPLVCSLFLFGYVPAVVSLLIGLSINIKRFFLHEMYRNRLVRAFLGASNTRSTQRDLFIFFNFTDTFPVSRLWGRQEERPPTTPSSSAKPEKQPKDCVLSMSSTSAQSCCHRQACLAATQGGIVHGQPALESRLRSAPRWQFPAPR